VQISRKYLVTGSIILVAVVAVLLKYWDFMVNPWTRDGQVRAEVIQVTTNLVAVYLSLGGGWELSQSENTLDLIPDITREEMLQRSKYWDKTFEEE